MVAKKEYQMNYILERCSPEPNTGCFLWTEKLDQRGYPVAMLPFCASMYPVKVRRIMWELVNRKSLGSLELWSTCKIRSCLNLSHMEVVDPANQESSMKEWIGPKVRRWIKEKRRKARRFEKWRLKNNEENR